MGPDIGNIGYLPHDGWPAVSTRYIGTRGRGSEAVAVLCRSMLSREEIHASQRSFPDELEIFLRAPPISTDKLVTHNVMYLLSVSQYTLSAPSNSLDDE